MGKDVMAVESVTKTAQCAFAALYKRGGVELMERVYNDLISSLDTDDLMGKIPMDLYTRADVKAASAALALLFEQGGIDLIETVYTGVLSDAYAGKHDGSRFPRLTSDLSQSGRRKATPVMYG